MLVRLFSIGNKPADSFAKTYNVVQQPVVQSSQQMTLVARIQVVGHIASLVVIGKGTMVILREIGI